MVTEKQRATIKAIGSHNENFATAAGHLHITKGALVSRVGEMFEDFEELLKIIDDNYPIFARRMKEHPELYRPLRSVARKMKKEKNP